MKHLLVVSFCWSLITALPINTDIEKLHSKVSGRIIGGDLTSIENHPYAVAFFTLDYFFCGGALIAQQWVLTAANCLSNSPSVELISLRAGSTNRNNGGQQVTVASYAIHPQFTDWNYDIAVVEINERFVFGPKIFPIAMGNLEPNLGTNVMAVGWGTVEQGLQTTELREVILPLVDRATCNRYWPGYIDESIICAGTANADSCGGDTGGPLVKDALLVGLVSWGSSVCGDGTPAAYTNLADFSVRKWVQDMTGI